MNKEVVMNCPYSDCGAPLDAVSQFCPICGRSVKVREPGRKEETAAVNEPGATIPVKPRPMTGVGTLESRYRALRTIAGVYQAVAILILIVAVIGAFVVFLTSTNLMSPFGQPSPRDYLIALVPAGSALVTGLLIFLVLYA
jgi:hypothetical protein